MKRRLFATVGVIAVLALSACGGTDTEGTASGAPSTSASAPMVSASPSMRPQVGGTGRTIRPRARTPWAGVVLQQSVVPIR
ncbi:hypothetical protein [Micromonospora foliorum]|uniref:hypothetical protein n=1 Tax=Micromonospora foliorum TaxID=2911210 RepID=UPI001EE9693B|nr:hypothetical protein [Micromonospora foliorum]MCG5440996.1 hypothetical protein [Micromonospora foliorum]